MSGEPVLVHIDDVQSGIYVDVAGTVGYLGWPSETADGAVAVPVHAVPGGPAVVVVVPADSYVELVPEPDGLAELAATVDWDAGPVDRVTVGYPLRSNPRVMVYRDFPVADADEAARLIRGSTLNGMRAQAGAVHGPSWRDAGTGRG